MHLECACVSDPRVRMKRSYDDFALCNGDSGWRLVHSQDQRRILWNETWETTGIS